MARKTCPLLASIRKSILPLNNALPSSVASIWMAPEEIHERLLMAGVMKGLTMCMLTDALRLNNNGKAFMTKTVHCNIVYYRSTVAHMNDRTKSVPMQQCFRGKTTGGVAVLIRMQQMNILFTMIIITLESLTMHWRHLSRKKMMK